MPTHSFHKSLQGSSYILITEEEFALGRALYADEYITANLPDPIPPEGKVAEADDFIVFDLPPYESMIREALTLPDTAIVSELAALGDAIYVAVSYEDPFIGVSYGYSPDGSITYKTIGVYEWKRELFGRDETVECLYVISSLNNESFFYNYAV